MEFVRKHKKLVVIAAAVLLVGALFAYDAVRASTYEIELVSITPEQPVADNKQHVTVVLRLTRYGTPVEGHSLFTLALNGGQFRGNRKLTDKDGCVELIYIPYTSTKLLPAGRVEVEVLDESNSVFIEINAKMTFYIDLKEKD